MSNDVKKLNYLILLSGVVFFINSPIVVHAENSPAVTIAEAPVLSESKIEQLKETISNMGGEELSIALTDYGLQTEELSDIDTVIYRLMRNEKEMRDKSDTKFMYTLAALGGSFIIFIGIAMWTVSTEHSGKAKDSKSKE